ncbi:purothionin A-1-like [Phragmites australis]|uniref:purothionin A-1-like n=1 Tax=Phragmites australis TaxID=29695 RepID=UPI002D76F0A1|nr:purothionin A-1-like [Phragmites australis]
MGSKGLESVIMCLLILGLVLEQVQVEGKSCCKSTFARHCYNFCRRKGPPVLCAKVCGCKIIRGNKCPPDYPKLNLLPDSGEPDTIEYCNLGCRSSVCDNMNNGHGGEEMKIDVERCGDACDSFCNGDAGIASVAA